MTAYYTIALIALLAVISPGPDFVVVTKYALSTDRINAVMAAIGVSVGVLVHASYCVLGLAVVISQSLLLFSLIKYLGVSYLIYLGIKSLCEKNQAGHLTQQKKQCSKGAAFIDGLLTNVLNPKCTLFMLSVFTLVVKPHTPMLVQASFGLEIALVTLLWFVFLSCSLTVPVVQLKLARVQHIVSKVIGVVFLAIGGIVLLESR